MIEPFPYTAEAWEYIESTRDKVCDLERRVRLSKANVESICTIMANWCKVPLYKRKGDKSYSLLNLEVSKCRHSFSLSGYISSS